MHGGGVAHLTIGLEATQVPGMPTRDFHGMSSHYLHTIRDGDRELVRQTPESPPTGS